MQREKYVVALTRGARWHCTLSSVRTEKHSTQKCGRPRYAERCIRNDCLGAGQSDLAGRSKRVEGYPGRRASSLLHWHRPNGIRGPVLIEKHAPDLIRVREGTAAMLVAVPASWFDKLTMKPSIRSRHSFSGSLKPFILSPSKGKGRGEASSGDEGRQPRRAEHGSGNNSPNHAFPRLRGRPTGLHADRAERPRS
jgi:hypothetical protein